MPDTSPDAADDRPASRVAKGAWIALSVLIIFYILAALDRGIISLLVSPIKGDLDLSDSEMSLVLGLAFGFFYAVCGIPFGWLIDNFSRRAVLFCGVIFWSLAALCTSLVQTYPQLLVARMALGMGEAALNPAAHSILADKFPRERMATALSVYSMGAAIGGGLALALGGLVITYFSQFETVHFVVLGELKPWQAVFACVGLPGLLLAFLAFTFKESAPRRAAADGPKVRVPMGPFLKRRRALLFCFAASFGCVSMIIWSVNAWFPAFMDRNYGWSPAEIGSSFGLVSMSSTLLGGLIAGLVVDRMVARGHDDAHLRVLALTLVIGVPLGVVGFLAANPYVALVMIFLLKLLVFSCFGYGAAAMQIITPQALRGRMAALYLLGMVLLGNGLGPFTVAMLTEYVFRNPMRLGDSLAALAIVVAPIAIFAAWKGMALMRVAVREVDDA